VKKTCGPKSSSKDAERVLVLHVVYHPETRLGFCRVAVMGSSSEYTGFLSRWDSYAVISLEAVAYSSYCNTVEWFWWD